MISLPVQAGTPASAAHLAEGAAELFVNLRRLAHHKDVEWGVEEEGAVPAIHGPRLRRHGALDKIDELLRLTGNATTGTRSGGPHDPAMKHLLQLGKPRTELRL